MNYRVKGIIVATTTVYRDQRTSKACALFWRPKSSATYGQSTYMALILCNEQGPCDSDWFNYKIEAGPVSVPDAKGCLSWRVSMRGPGGTQWVLRDIVGQVGC